MVFQTTQSCCHCLTFEIHAVPRPPATMLTDKNDCELKGENLYGIINIAKEIVLKNNAGIFRCATH